MSDPAATAADPHAGADPTTERIIEAHSAMTAEMLSVTPDGHTVYKQGHDERCYICTLLGRLAAAETARDELAKELLAINARLEGIDSTMDEIVTLRDASERISNGHKARVTQLETALTEAMQSLATGPLKEGYAYEVLARAVDSKP